MDDDGLRRTALDQHGLVTNRQVFDAGGTDAVIAHRVRRGQWHRIRRGVLVVGAAPSTWDQQVMAACLAGGAGHLAADRTAARLWTVVSRSGRIQLLTEGTSPTTVRGVTTRRTRSLPAVDRTVVRGIPVTSLARTLVDASIGQEPAVVVTWVDDATRRLGLNLVDLRSCIARLAAPGRRRPTALVTALAQLDPSFTPGQSALEDRALHALRRAGLPAPVLQHPVRRPNGRMAYIDIAYPEVGLAIELDGWEHHGTRAAFDQDRARANDLTVLGWRVLRFTWTMSDRDLVRTVSAALAPYLR